MDQTDNSSYSVKSQTTKGLSTFVLTLSISLIVFSIVYYLMTVKTNQQDEFLTSDVSLETDSVGEGVLSSEDTSSSGEDDKFADAGKSVFGDIAKVSPGTSSRQVLAGSTSAPSGDYNGEYVEDTAVTGEVNQTTSGNLETGVTSITIGLMLSMSFFIFAMLFLYKNPRKIALDSFEKKSTKNL